MENHFITLRDIYSEREEEEGVEEEEKTVRVSDTLYMREREFSNIGRIIGMLQ